MRAFQATGRAAFKFVVCESSDLDEVDAIVEECRLTGIWIMPEGTDAQTLLKQEIPSANTQIWTVPWNDLAQTSNQLQSGAEPKLWLQRFAQSQFPVIFVDAFVSNAHGEHYRFEVHGTDSIAYFIHQLTINAHGGAFNG